MIPPRLEQGRDAIIAIAERVERVQEQHKAPGEEFRGLKFGLMEVVYEWAKGMVGRVSWFLAFLYSLLPCSRLNRLLS